MRSKTPEYRAAYWRKWAAKNRPAVTKKCGLCGRPFSPHGPQKRCHECRHLTCAQCGVRFIPSNSTLKHRFCSVACKAASQKGAEPEHLKRNRGRKPRTHHLTKRDKHGGAMDTDWRLAVFERDDYTCRHCGQRGGRLQAHHIQPYKKHPELRHDLDNGLTLCIECHKKTDSFGWQNYWRNHVANRLRQEVLPL